MWNLYSTAKLITNISNLIPDTNYKITLYPINLGKLFSLSFEKEFVTKSSKFKIFKVGIIFDEKPN